ncbi:MAG TPA: hydroxyisourate hydrolase [Minicystis sp.]|nr:hydroxyisourate hydrolase [Minicystis sp.]
MSAITTHVLDTARGRPAAGVLVVLDRATNDDPPHYQELGRGATDADGRLRTLLAPEAHLIAGTYRLTFHTAAYFHALGVEAFYPEVAVLFTIRDASQHFHVPLLLSPFGYSTYRGS